MIRPPVLTGINQKRKKRNMPKTIPQWVKQRQAEIQKQYEEYVKTKGQYFNFPLGETAIFIKDIPPEKKVNKWGNEMYEYQIEVNGENKKISANVILDKAIIQALSEDINPMTVIRTGKGKDTRYSIKELETT